MLDQTLGWPVVFLFVIIDVLSQLYQVLLHHITLTSCALNILPRSLLLISYIVVLHFQVLISDLPHATLASRQGSTSHGILYLA